MHLITGSGSSVVSLDGSTLDAGSMVIEVPDSAGKSDTANISFPKRTLKLDLDKGARGTVVKVTGTGFQGWNTLAW